MELKLSLSAVSVTNKFQAQTEHHVNSLLDGQRRNGKV